MSLPFGTSVQTYASYVQLLIVKLWNRCYYGADEEPGRIGEAYSSMWTKFNDFWTDAPTLVSPYVYVGSAKNAADGGSLQRLGIMHVVNATIDLPNFYRGLVDGPKTYTRVPLKDCRDASLVAMKDSIDHAIRNVEKAVANKEPVLIHCMMGASRSVAVACLYIRKAKSIQAIEAYSGVSRERRQARLNVSFMDDIRSWEF